MKRTKRHGFTLVELLVVIAIIGILMGLLLPAIQSARENARRMDCANNMRNFTQAIFKYEGTHGRYPGYVETIGPTTTPLYRPWVYILLDSLERQDVAEYYNATNWGFAGIPTTADGWPRDPTHLGLAVCPSNPEFDGFPMHYVLNTGIDDFWLSSSPSYPYNPSDGVFNFAPRLTNRTMNSSSITDGVSTTACMSENIQAQNWIDMQEVYCGFMWHPNYNPTNPAHVPMRINQDVEFPSAPSTFYSRPSSRHPTAVNMSFLDSSLRQINEEIDYLVYAHLLTPKGRTATNFLVDPIDVGYQLQNAPPLDEADFR